MGCSPLSGVLDLRMGGPGYSAFAPNFNYVRVYDPKPKHAGPGGLAAAWLYQTKVRMAAGFHLRRVRLSRRRPVIAKRRSRSTTPLQALNLFNSGFVTQQAGLFAARLQRDAGDDVPSQVRRGFQLAFDRDPDAVEGRVCGKRSSAITAFQPSAGCS